MNIGLLDAIKLLDNGTTEDLAEIAVKYDVSAGDALVMAMQRAAKVMKTAVPMEAKKSKCHVCPLIDLSQYEDDLK